MTLSTLYLGSNGTIVYHGHAGFLLSTVGFLVVEEHQPGPPTVGNSHLESGVEGFLLKASVFRL